MNIRIITTILLAATVAQADEMKLWRHLRTEMASSVTQGWLETRNDAASRKCRLTMDELIKENKRLEVDLTGLKV
jgi:hypothetical protein